MPEEMKLSKQLEDVCKNEAAWLYTAMVKSKYKTGSCEPVFNVINRIIAESDDPKTTKEFYEFLISGCIEACNSYQQNKDKMIEELKSIKEA
jgi:hypothetical protein